MSIGLQQIWAKTEPFQSILTHSFISGIVAQVIVHKMIVPGVRNKLLALLSCTPEKFTDWIGYLVSLHDVGKIEGQFQYRWLPMKESMDKEGVKPDFPALNQIRHEKTTWRCLRERLWKEASNQSAAKFYADSPFAAGRCPGGRRRHRCWPGSPPGLSCWSTGAGGIPAPALAPGQRGAHSR